MYNLDRTEYALYLYALDFNYNYVSHHPLSVDRYSNFCVLTIQLMIGLLNSWKSSILDSDSGLVMTRPALPLFYDYFNEHQNQPKRRAVNEWIHRFESVDDEDDDDEEDDEDD